MFKPGRNSLCPCGSGKKFKQCCSGKAFTYTAEDEDSYSLKIPMNNRMREIIARQAETFRRHFEREPGSGVPFFLAKYLYSEQDLERETVAGMKAAGMDPAFIYAYKKTGYIQVESQLHRYTGAAIAEWDEAIAEFDLHGGEPDEGPEAHLFDTTLKSLADEFESFIYALGLANDNYFNTDLGAGSTEASSAILSLMQYQALCASRVHRTLRTVMQLEEKCLSEDMLKLARSIYESYLHMVVVQMNPSSLETLVDSIVGVRRGTHAYKKRKNGDNDKRVIIHIASGREIPSQISAFKMAASSPFAEDVDFFDFFYSTTSELIHPTVFALDGYVSSHGLDPVKPHMHEEAVVFTACVAAMVVDWIPRMNRCPNQVAADCRTVVRRAKKKLLTLLELLEVWNKRIGASKSELGLIKARCLRLDEG
jgi:hypothetical protein